MIPSVFSLLIDGLFHFSVFAHRIEGVWVGLPLAWPNKRVSIFKKENVKNIAKTFEKKPSKFSFAPLRQFSNRLSNEKRPLRNVSIFRILPPLSEGSDLGISF